MRKVFRLRRLLRCVRGQDMVEYALVAGFLAVTAGATLPGMRENLGAIYRNVSKTVHGVATGSRGPTGPPTSL